MFRIERQEKMLEYINEKQHVKTQELADAFGTSVVTIRNDIGDLAARGLVIKTHGGAVCCQHSPNMEIPSVIRQQENIESKQAIAALAAGLIEDGDVIILDAGSTTLEIARRIQAQNVTVLTNDIKIGVTLAERGGVHNRGRVEEQPGIRSELLNGRKLLNELPGEFRINQLISAGKEKGGRGQEDALNLMTFHASKGLEFRRVYLIDLNEGLVPHRRAKTKEEIEEERRVLYVAMTRAKEELYLLYTEKRGGRDIPPSRFLRELI